MFKVMAKVSPCFVSKDRQNHDTVKVVPLPAALLGLKLLEAAIFQGQHSIFLPLAY